MKKMLFTTLTVVLLSSCTENVEVSVTPTISRVGEKIPTVKPIKSDYLTCNKEGSKDLEFRFYNLDGTFEGHRCIDGSSGDFHNKSTKEILESITDVGISSAGFIEDFNVYYEPTDGETTFVAIYKNNFKSTHGINDIEYKDNDVITFLIEDYTKTPNGSTNASFDSIYNNSELQLSQGDELYLHFKVNEINNSSNWGYELKLEDYDGILSNDLSIDIYGNSYANIFYTFSVELELNSYYEVKFVYDTFPTSSKPQLGQLSSLMYDSSGPNFNEHSIPNQFFINKLTGFTEPW